MPTTNATVPARTRQQRLDALERANEVRFYRADLKRALKDGRVLVVDVLTGTDPMLDTMKIDELLLACPKLGRAKVNRILRMSGVSPSRTLCGLTVRQRAALVSACLGTEPVIRERRQRRSSRSREWVLA